MPLRHFDYLILGAGSAGCALARNLTQKGHVALLEAGQFDWLPCLHIPAAYFRTKGNQRTDWCYSTQPDPGIANRSISWPRGKVLGGSSSINGLLWVRGQRQDFEEWGKENKGWSWENVLPAFKKLENWKGQMNEYRSRQGPIHVEPSKLESEVIDAWLKAAQQAGYSRNPDYNGARQEGVSHFQMTVRQGYRSSAVQFIRQLQNSPNLTIHTQTLAKRLLFDGNRAVGIVTENNGQKITYTAERQIILSLGSINTPQLLMLSGVGPRSSIQNAAIECWHHLPAVGQNLKDHLQATSSYYCLSSTLNTLIHSPTSFLKQAYRFMVHKQGLLTMGAGSAFLSTQLSPNRPDIEFHIQPFSTDDIREGPHAFSGMTSSVLQLRPQSKGRIILNPADAYDHPLIYPCYLSAQLDKKTLIEGIKISRQIMRQPALKFHIAGQYGPLKDIAVDDDDRLLDWARRNCSTIYHPTSTCRMGKGEESVVDEELKVHGIKGLRIADASIMPNITSGNTNAPSLMIGQRLGDMILNERS